MEPSWGNFFLWLDREVYHSTGILRCKTVFFGPVLSRVLWEGKLCEGGPCGVWGRVVSDGPWIISAQRIGVSLSFIIDPWPVQAKKNEGAKAGGEPFPLAWSSWWNLPLQFSSALWDAPEGGPNTYVDRSWEVGLVIIYGKVTKLCFSFFS